MVQALSFGKEENLADNQESQHRQELVSQPVSRETYNRADFLDFLLKAKRAMAQNPSACRTYWTALMARLPRIPLLGEEEIYGAYLTEINAITLRERLAQLCMSGRSRRPSF